MHEMLPLTKGHIPNKDRIVWQKPGGEVDYGICIGYTCNDKAWYSS